MTRIIHTGCIIIFSMPRSFSIAKLLSRHIERVECVVIPYSLVMSYKRSKIPIFSKYLVIYLYPSKASLLKILKVRYWYLLALENSNNFFMRVGELNPRKTLGLEYLEMNSRHLSPSLIVFSQLGSYRYYLIVSNIAHAYVI